MNTLMVISRPERQLRAIFDRQIKNRVLPLDNKLLYMLKYFI